MKNLTALILGAVFFFAKHILLAMGYTPAQIPAVNLSGAVSGVSDSDTGMGIEGKGRDAGLMLPARKGKVK